MFLEGWKVPLDVILIVTSDLTVHEAILGLDFIEEHKCLIDCSRKLLAFPRDGPYVQIQCRPSSHTAAALGEAVGLLTAEKIVVPPGSEMELMVKQTSGATGGTWFVESRVAEGRPTFQADLSGRTFWPDLQAGTRPERPLIKDVVRLLNLINLNNIITRFYYIYYYF